MHILIPDAPFELPSGPASAQPSPAVETPASPFHPLLAARSSPAHYFTALAHSASPEAAAMNTGRILSLQTQVAHGRHAGRPQVQPVQASPPARKPSPSGSSSSGVSSASSSSTSIASPQCTRCQQSIGQDGNKAVSFGTHLHYCRSCIKLLESRG